jgi:hypothetical protein
MYFSTSKASKQTCFFVAPQRTHGFVRAFFNKKKIPPVHFDLSLLALLVLKYIC